MDKISIIIPVYNVEKYLARCVDSVLMQNYENMEIILIDDGSPDKSGDICDAYARQDNRIIVIHQKNKGLSGARNSGLDISTGKYITFIDSDDSIMPDMFSTMINIMEQNNLDILFCNSVRVKNNDTYILVQKDNKFKIIEKDKILCETLANGGGSVWGAIYSRKAIGNYRFPEGRLFEDSAVKYKFIANAERIGEIENIYYKYYYNPESITQTSFSPKARWDYVLALREAFEYASKTKSPSINASKSIYLKSLLSCLTAVYASNNKADSDKYFPLIEKEIYKHRDRQSYAYLNLKYKLYLYFFGKANFIHIVGAKLSKIFKDFRKLVKTR